MGALNRGEIVAQGINLAGHTGIASNAATYLNAWLADVYAGWPWAFANTTYGPFDMPSSGTFIFGGGVNTADHITSVFRLGVSNGISNSLVADLNLFVDANVPEGNHPLWRDPVTRAWSDSAYVGPRQTEVPGQWEINLQSVPAGAYRLLINANKRIANLTLDSQVPLYPNDLTLIHAVYVFALRWQQDERWSIEEGALNRMIAQDRLKYGQASGTNRSVGLSRARFH